MTLFERGAPFIGVFYLAPSIMAGVFLHVVITGGSPIKPDTYGGFVYAIPAWVWATSQLSICLGAAISAFTGNPRVHALFAFLCGALMLFFGASALFGDAEEVILVAMAIPTGALCFLSGWVGWDHGR